MDGELRDLGETAVCSRELDGWRVICQLHPQAYPRLDFHTHLAPAFRFGLYARRAWRDAAWNADLEDELAYEWEQHRGASGLPWQRARSLVRHGFEGFRGPRPAPLPVRRPVARSMRTGGGWIGWLLRLVPQGRRIGTAG